MIMIKYVDSGGQVHLVTNIRKPRKWRRYEYLQSSGTQYIDTGIYGNLNTKVDLKITTTEDANYSIFGDYVATNQSTFCIGRASGAAKIFAQFDSVASNIINVLPSVANTTYTISLSKDGFINDNIKYREYPNATTFTTTNTLKIFEAFYSAKNKGKFKLYYCKIYDNDTLIRDFVPAQYNGQYGMWDLVEDKFYRNAGTGSFTVGPEIKNYDEIYEVRKTSSILPAGVELYDYIQSSGTQWIDTGFIPDNTSGIKLEAYCTTSGGNHQITGSRQNSGNTRWWINFSSTLELSWNTWVRTINNYTNTWVTIEHNYLNSRVGKVNEEQKRTDYPTLTNITYPAYIFNSNNQGNLGTGFEGKVKYLQFTEGDQIVHNFLPCTYLGEPGMWDTVENKFYRNQGTGQFTLGNKITLKEYEYLQSSGTQYIDTKVKNGQDIEIDVKFSPISFPSSSSSFNSIIAARISASSNSISQGYTIGGNTYFGFGNNSEINIGNILAINNWFILRQNKDYIKLNNQVYNYLSGYNTNFTVTGNMFIFARNNYNTSGITTSIGNYSTIKVQYCKIYKNDILIRDYIPCSYNGTPGLWDKVEWKFYANAGSGSFTLGPEKASGIYPVWTPIEYLQSSGVQYINTGLSGLEKTSHEIQFTNRGSGSCFTNATTQLEVMDSRYGTSSYGTYTISAIRNSSNVYVYTNKTNDTVFTNMRASNTNKDYIFALNSNNSPGFWCTNLKIYSYKAYNGNTLILDMIPVRIGNTGYMFDKVTGKMFGNSGTGNFVLGPDINT